jgi:ABC-type ATPase involved in cell division
VNELKGAELALYRQRTVGVVFQAFNLIPSLSARSNVMVPLRLAGVSRAQARVRADALLDRVGLTERAHHRPAQLSGGQQQRVAIARALVQNPPLVVADEPTAHLDHIQVEGVLKLLRELAAPGRIVVVATHDDRVTHIADRVVELVPHFVNADRAPEDSSLGVAGACGIAMEPCRLLEENDRAHFMTRRFDRRADGSKVHTQTLCALDQLDFNLADTHSYAQYLDVIDRLGLGPDAREQGFRRLVFNVAGANRDDHTKNLSFRCDEDGTWSLSPAYDVNYAYNPQGRWTQRHQMSVNGKFEDITKADLLDLADRYVVPAPARVIDDVLEAVGRWRSFAEEAGVEEAQVERIAGDLVAFRPR